MRTILKAMGQFLEDRTKIMATVTVLNYSKATVLEIALTLNRMIYGIDRLSLETFGDLLLGYGTLATFKTPSSEQVQQGICLYLLEVVV